MEQPQHQPQHQPQAQSVQQSSSSGRQVMQVHVGSFSNLYEALSIEASKLTTAGEIVECIADKLGLKEAALYELAEVVGNEGGQDCKERRIGLTEYPVALQLLWPKNWKQNGRSGSFSGPEYRFCLRRKMMQSMNWSFSWTDSTDSQLLKDYFLRFLYQPRDREYPDLCQLPDLTEQTLLENLKARFEKGHIYTYVGSILIAVNPFKFYPIYNPKYVQLYQNRRLGDLPPHIFAIADAAYQAMLRKRCNQCIVISGESGSGKTESTNFLLHHLTALSQKGSHGSGVERTILGAGPVLEAFGNAKTKFNNNSSRFGKFIQVKYKENGMVHGAIVQKYLLEKSRIVSHAKNERNYHVFYYMLAGCTPEEKESLCLGKASDYFYLNQSKCYTLEGVDEVHELSRLKQSLEMVGFSAIKQRRVMALLAAVLHLGNVEFSKKSAYHNDETVMVKNASVVSIISQLLMVKEEDLLSALTCKRTVAAKGEMIIINYKMADAIATRDAMAKCLYGALFDWIVWQINSSLLGKQDLKEHKGNYIGVLDIFGFEDFGDQNFFEQFCINFANEHLHFYFNQHVFKYEQEEYKREGINWKNIDFHDNVGCLNLVQGRPYGLLCLLDDQCNFPGASDETVLQKFVNHHNDNPLFEVPPCRQSAFVIKHYAGKVKYQIRDFREKNMDLMRPDIVSLLKGSSSSFVRELVGQDPLALFRWQILKAFFKAYFYFTKLREESKKRRETNGSSSPARVNNRTGSNIQALTKRLGIECMTRKNKVNRIPSLKSGAGMEKTVKNFKTLRVIVGKGSSIQGPPRTGRKTTQTVTFQFQQSLNQLMETLNQANPFFVRCIKSNADKIPGHFDDMLVLVQLRYTGMLDTVKIRQSGYSVRLSFEEFIQHYRILLPKGLLSSQSDIRDFIARMNLNQENYQLGKSKIFMRESEKLALDNLLHREILQRIVTLQRWVRTWITRRKFLRIRAAAVCIQSHARRFFAQQKLSGLKELVTCEKAAVTIQKTWKAFKDRTSFRKLRAATINFQAHARGYLLRKEVRRTKSEYRENQKTQPEERRATEPCLPRKQTSDKCEVATSNKVLRGHSEEEEVAVSSRFTSPRTSTSGSTPVASSSRKASRDSVSSIRRDSVEAEISSSSYSSSRRGTRQASLSSPVSVTPSAPPPLPPRRASQAANTARKSHSDEITPIKEDEVTVRRRSRPVNRRPSMEKASAHSLSPSPDKEIAKVVDDVFREPAATAASDAMIAKSKGLKNRLRQMIIGNIRAERQAKENSASNGDELFYENVSNQISNQTTAKSQSESSLASGPPNSPDPLSAEPHVSPLYDHDVDDYIGMKSDSCCVCQNSTQGKGCFKCSGCNLIFHKKCFAVASHFPCPRQKIGGFGPATGKSPPRQSRNKNRSKEERRRSSRKSEAAAAQSGPSTSWSVTRTTEFTDPKDVLIADVSELHYLETFLNKKINLIEDSKSSASKESVVDVIFKSALKEFKKNLISTYSVVSQDPHQMHISYKNLIENFEQVMIHVCQTENTFKSFPVIMGVNAFRGFLDEFRSIAVKFNLSEKNKNKNQPKRRRNKLSRSKKEEIIESYGHVFRPVQANIPTVCEVCSSLMWLMEKVWVCQGCKLTCHKKCTSKVIASCKVAGFPGQRDQRAGCFGIAVERLVDDEHRVPQVVEDLMTAIELKGLYTEGLYRKSGIASKVSEVKTKLDHSEKLDLDSFSVHVLTGVLKSFFREMPEPLMTFELYDDFLWASITSDPQERVQAIYSHISKLPRAHFDLLERLSFHLARVAQHEQSNRMSANSLAIVIAPCVLRTDRPMQMQDKLSDISKQTICIQTIISERLKQVCDTLEDIDILDSAFRTAASRLSSLRQSKLHLNSETAQSTQPTEANVDEEVILKHQLQTLRSEKAHLTTMLPTFRLTASASEEDLTLPDLDNSTVGSSLDPDLDSASPTLSKPFSLADVMLSSDQFPSLSAPPQTLLSDSQSHLRHLTKNRCVVPHRRLPTRVKGSGDGVRNCNVKRLKSESNPNQVEQELFQPDDKPVTV